MGGGRVKRGGMVGEKKGKNRIFWFFVGGGGNGQKIFGPRIFFTV